MKRFSLVVCLVFSIIFAWSGVQADTGTYVPVSGIDATGDAPAPLTVTSNGDIFKLSLSDDKRMASNAAWPGTGVYVESKSLEFIFAPDIPIDAIISSVVVTHEYRRNTILAGAKLEVWDGAVWNDVALLLPDVSSTDVTEAKDITSLISTVSAVNSLKIRFLAYRNTVATSATTSHDYLGLSVSYTGGTTPSPTPTPTPSPTSTPTPSEIPTPTPSETPTPTPMPSATSTSIPMPSLTLVPTPTPTLTPTPMSTTIPVQTSLPIATPIPIIMPISTPESTLTPLPTSELTAQIFSTFQTPILCPEPSLKISTKVSRTLKQKTPALILSPSPSPIVATKAFFTLDIFNSLFHRLALLLHNFVI